ncbi:hypothetical protein EC845_3212 [Comamonas sp. BIGb0124]|uniref:hypothetical protein n=1 Tax=Comamonas sp. BIGb0124 TaxID=2485130 RepID=UPI000F466929|nr:hypothetical protein [Comamonas sp. BIGb0124]ROR20392.1 hypothetical protein EC845_3212 [Comamonas sp. BIGb0124]
MNWFEFINHIVNLVLPACGVALLLGLAAGLVGRKGSRPAASVWACRVAINAAVGSGVLLAGLLIMGGDGHMATYAALVIVMGGMQAWQMRGR